MPMHLKASPQFVEHRNVAYHALEQSRLSDAPYAEAQEELERLFDKNQLKKRLRQVFNVPEFKKLFDERDTPDNISFDFIVDLCVQMCIHKRAQPGTLIGILYHHFDDGHGRQIAMQRCADALAAASDADFVDYYGGRKEFVVRFELDAETQQEIDRYQYPLPMVVQPKPIRNNYQNGYSSKETGKGLVVLNAGPSAPLYGQADLCLDHLNRVNSIPLTLNMSVAELIDNKWKDLDRPKPGEHAEDYHKRLKAFERYDQTSKDVMHAINGIRGRFWMTHKYDRRGRVYACGYHINPQGTSWNKAVVEFANKEELRDGPY